MSKIRQPAVDNYFYPGTKTKLLETLENLTNQQSTKEAVVSVICPHAGYIFSGATAGMVYSNIIIPETVILLGPNHQGYGEPFGVSSSEYWRTPLGEIKIDTDIAKDLVSESRYLEFDDISHKSEHSLEVQIPFIQFFNPQTEIVPISLSGYIDNPAWVEIGESIAKVIQKYNPIKNVLIIASTDMNHYESQENTEEKDKYAIETILSLDENLLIERIAEKNISMCGYGAVIATIVASKELGAKETSLIEYTTSGAKNKDYSQVVGYAGIIIK
jgi:AmmeMemoRadiSam system protein B